MELTQAMNERRSIRKYQNRPVEEETVRELIEAAILAPSWKNMQTSRYYAAITPEKRNQVWEALPEFNRSNTKDAPVLIVTTIVLNKVGFNKDGSSVNELGNGWGYYDCGLHNMNLMLKAAELGLGTLIMGMRDADALKQILNIPENESVVAVISVGYPDIDPVRPKRKTVDEIAKFY